MTLPHLALLTILALLLMGVAYSLVRIFQGHRSHVASTRAEFARSAVIFFVWGFGIVLLLEVLESRQLVSGLGESVTRFVICTALIGVLLQRMKRSPLSPLFRASFMFCGLCLILRTFTAMTSDVASMDSFPGLGNDGEGRHILEKALLAGWTCGFIHVLYVLIGDLEESHRQQQTTNEDLKRTVHELEAAQQRLVQQERLSALGTMASGVAHDLNNALTPVVIYSDVLTNSELSEPERREAADIMCQGVSHAAKVIERLQCFCRTDREFDVKQTRVDLSTVAQLAIGLTRFRWCDEALENGVMIQLHRDLADQCHVLGDETELVQLTTNLLLNALDAVSHSGNIWVVTRIQDDRVELEVRDDGIGMSHDLQQKCREPFVTSKPEGTGLGLSVCHGIAERHQGRMSIESQRIHGTRVRVSFPPAGNSRAQADQHASHPARARQEEDSAAT